MAQTIWHQPTYFDQFQCIGASCEDTCCQGMNVNVDEGTFAKYQACGDAELKPRLQQLVTIRSEPTPLSFATIQATDATCPFLSEQLCSIQQKLGAEYLCQVCDTYPRVLHTAAAAAGERSLDLSCPEAARLVLNQRDGIRFEGSVAAAPQTWSIRSAILSILQNRRYAVSQRILLVGHVCAKLSEIYRADQQDTLEEVLGGFELAIEGGFFDGHLNRNSNSPVPQLAVALELIVGRIQLDYASPRFLELYNEFTEGLGLTPESTLDDLGLKYRENYEERFVPFMDEHEHILENYLVAYVYKNRFPFSGESADLATTIERQYMLMATYFSMTKALMIGVCGLRGSSFSLDDAIRVVQVLTRTIEHCTTLPALVLETLAAKGIANIAGMSILSQNVSSLKHKAARC